MVLKWYVIVFYQTQLETHQRPGKKKSKAQKVLMMLILRYLAYMRMELDQIDFRPFFVPLLSFFTSDSENDPQTFCHVQELSYLRVEQSERRGGWAASYRPRSLPNLPRQSVNYVQLLSPLVSHAHR